VPKTARSIISRNKSPDVGFSQSVNPYRGCEHGCSYCFARPSHAYLNLSPGLDFETKLFAKTNAPQLLRKEFSRPAYAPQPIALGINTDAYQPIERKLKITRQLIEVMLETQHPFSLITKNALVERDIDLLAPLAEKNLVSVHFSVTSLDPHLSARLEPRASAPHARLRAMRRLHEAGIPVGVMVAPVIPWINDAELEAVLEAAHDAGAIHRRLRPAAPAAGSGAAVPRLARHPPSRPRRACHEHHQPAARGQGLQQRVWHPHARRRRLCRSAVQPLQAGPQAHRLQRAEQPLAEAGLHEVPAAVAAARGFAAGVVVLRGGARKRSTHATTQHTQPLYPVGAQLLWCRRASLQPHDLHGGDHGYIGNIHVLGTELQR
jgi:DNA repair photolyase